MPISHGPITTRHRRTLGDTEPPEAPDWRADIDNPYLHGLYAPTTVERTLSHGELRIEGSVPTDLRGAYLRNGPNPQFPPTNRYHWFDGDGMIHGLWFDGGNVQYRNRYIHTKALAHERQAGAAVWPGVLGPFDFSLPWFPIKDTANTDLLPYGDQVLALWYESGEPYTLDPRTLETTGVADLGPKVPVSAHARVDAATGDLLFFNYGPKPPFMQYGVRRSDGTTHLVDIDLPGPRRPHDMGVSENYCILHDFPIFYSDKLFKQTGKRIPLFHPDVPTRFGVIPRFGTEVQWFEFSPCYMLHVINCWEEGDELVMVGCRNPDPSLRPDPEDGKLAAMLNGLKVQAALHEWRMNLVTGATSERSLGDANLEFPRINPDWTGRQNRYAYLQEIPLEIPATFEALVKVDLQTGIETRWPYGPHRFGSETPFAPRLGGTAEDDGYVMGFVTDTRDWSSCCEVFDAQRIEDGPVCRIHLPHRLPAGFHATWVPLT